MDLLTIEVIYRRWLAVGVIQTDTTYGFVLRQNTKANKRRHTQKRTTVGYKLQTVKLTYLQQSKRSIFLILHWWWFGNDAISKSGDFGSLPNRYQTDTKAPVFGMQQNQTRWPHNSGLMIRLILHSCGHAPPSSHDHAQKRVDNPALSGTNWKYNNNSNWGCGS